MRKSNLIVITAIAVLAMAGISTHAQVAMNIPRDHVSPAYRDDVLGIPEGVKSRAVNLKAERTFERDYKQTSGVEWSVLTDQSLLCRFFMRSILHRAFYTAQGQWQCTVSGYDASKLDKRIYEKVKSVYYNSSIVYVDQIDMVKDKTIYVVEIQDEKSIRKVRVSDDEMEVILEFERQ